MGKLGRNIHTVYDMMDARGDFDANPANPQSRDPVSGEALYKGPVQFPVMLYHPEGKKRTLSPAVPGQAAVIEIINKVAKTRAEFDELRKQGWHEHPVDALKASGVSNDLLPAKGSTDRVAQLEAQIAEQNAELARLREGKLQDDAADGDE